VALLEPHAVPCAPILSIPDALAHPQVVARGMRGETGGIPMLATPMRFDGQRLVAPLAPPQLDEHGKAIRQALIDHPGWPSP
jgi:crotonobetainyl-CoA:carnitine CoA-transferase CaiB-like acyl-CoA transferase